MKRRTALILTFVAVMAAAAAALAVLGLLDASSEAVALAYLLILCVGSGVISLVVVHYEP